MDFDHRYYLEEALKEARKAKDSGQIPVGAIIVDKDGNIISRKYNQVNEMKKRTAHAEMLAIEEALTLYDGINAPSWTLYVTLEPCLMCMGTIIMSHIGSVVWASPDIHINTHKILNVVPYLRTRKLAIIQNPYPDINRKAKSLHDTYWRSIGREDVIEPIIE